jgi:L-iditol 2-dehydrogenase
MKGVVRRSLAANDVELLELPEPSPSEGQVKIQVEYAGICGSDVKSIERPIEPNSKVIPPVVLGHEGVGIIVEVGPGTTNLKVGDRVAAETTVTACGVCRYCRSGRVNMCLDRKGLGSRANGYFADFVIARAAGCHVIPDDVDPRAAAVLEPLGCAVNAVIQRSTVNAGDVAVVFGPGTIGQCVAQVAKACGAYVIVVGTQRSKPRLKIASELGADVVLVTGEDDIPAIVSDITDGYGADIVYECVGSESAFKEGLKCVRKLGQFVIVASASQPVEFDVRSLFSREIALIGAISTDPTTWDISMRLLTKHVVNLLPLVTAVIPLEEWRLGYAKGKTRDGLKILLKP